MKKTAALVVLFIAGTLLLQASVQSPDSLFNLYTQTKSAPVRLDAANQLVKFFYENDVFEGQPVFTSKTPADSVAMLVYQGMGIYTYYDSDFPRAKDLGIKGVELSEKMKDTTSLSICYSVLSSAYLRMAQHDKAVEILDKSMEIALVINDIDAQANIYNSLAAISHYMKKYSTAIDYYQKAIDLVRKLKDEERMAAFLSNQSETYSSMKQYEKATAGLTEALELDEKGNRTVDAAIRRMNLASVYSDLKEYDKAEKLYLEALEVFRKGKKRNTLAQTAYELGVLYERKREPNRAIALFKESLELSKEIGFKFMERNNNRALYRVYYKQLKDPANAMPYLEKTMELNDSLYKEENSKQVEELNIKYETAEKEAKLAIQEADLSKTKSQRLTFILATVFALLLSAALYYLYRIRNRQNKKLKEMNATKNKLFSIISHDLKSPVAAQKLAVENMLDNIENNNTDFLLKNLNEFRQGTETQLDLLQNLLNWARMQTGEMRFRPTTFDLCEMMSEVVELYKLPAKNKEITIKMERVENCIATADRQITHTVLRNLLNNAIKFSHQGGEISINISRNNDKIALKIKDNGVGISKERIKTLFSFGENKTTNGTNGEVGSGLGLIICKELLEQSGSQLVINSEEGKGTKAGFEI